MHKNDLYQHLRLLYLRGNLKAFHGLYLNLAEESRTEPLRELAIKALKEANDWTLLFSEVSLLMKSPIPEFHTKAQLLESFFTFLLQVQSRKKASAVLAQCQEVSLKYKGKELDFFAQKISMNTQMAMITLGLSDAAQKTNLIETGIICCESYALINQDESNILLESLIGHCISLPIARPEKALQILGRFQKLPIPDDIPVLQDVPFRLHYIKARLLLEYFDRSKLSSPESLPDFLLEIMENVSQINHQAFESHTYSIYGNHLLTLEYLEGAMYLEKTLNPFWELGHGQSSFNNKKQIISWLETRGFSQEADQFQSNYQHITTSSKAFFEENLEKLRRTHQFFSEAAYSAGRELIETEGLREESETFTVSYASLLVNSAAKLQSERQTLLDKLDEQINLLASIQHSYLLAQLYAFKTQLEMDPSSQSYRKAFHLYDFLGFTDEAVTILTNLAYDSALHRKQIKATPLISNELVQAFQNTDTYLRQAKHLPNRVSLEAELLQRWGIVLMLNNQADQAADWFQTAGSLFLSANHPFSYAINTHHLASAFIMLGRNQGRLDYYDKAIEHLNHGIEILKETKVIDFYWRLHFSLANALSEPLKYQLEADPGKHQERLKNADRIYHQTLDIFSLILKRNSLVDKSQKLLAYGHLNQEIRQLIFAGFYCYFFEQHWEKCVLWLEKIRTKTLLSAIADKIDPPIPVSVHELLQKEMKLKQRLSSAATIPAQWEIKDELEQLYQQMRQDEQLKTYAFKKQEALPGFPEIMAGLAEEARIAGHKIVVLYYCSPGDDIYSFGILNDLYRILFEKIQQLSAVQLQIDLSHSYSLLLRSYHKLKPGEQFFLKYSNLIAPVEKWTDPNDLICIIPYGFLHDLPYHALLIDGIPLIRRNPVFYNSSLGSWDYLRQKTNTPSMWEKPAIFSNPDEHLNLSLTLEEAASIGALLNTTPRQQAEVTKEHFLKALSSCSLMHFAGHGFYDNKEGLESGLLLWGNEMMNVVEIMNQSIATSLVVLSACDSGLHRNHPGEERAGLVSAFLAAGARSVIASLWRVTDEDANRFFTEFYPRLKEGKPKAIAIQETMIQIMEHPGRSQFYHWGAFSLHGYWM